MFYGVGNDIFKLRLEISFLKKSITNLIIFNYTHTSRECQKNRDKFVSNRTNCINYTHNFCGCQKNLEKILKFLSNASIFKG